MRFTVSVWVVWFQVAFGLLLWITTGRCGVVLLRRFGGNAVGVLLGAAVSWRNRIIAFMW
jgi:hypothetical protein